MVLQAFVRPVDCVVLKMVLKSKRVVLWSAQHEVGYRRRRVEACEPVGLVVGFPESSRNFSITSQWPIVWKTLSCFFVITIGDVVV